MLSACATQINAGPITAYTRYCGATAPEATAQMTSMAGNIAADPSSEPSDTYRVTRITSTNTGRASRIAIGWITSIVPTPVPTPRPLRNPTKTDQIAPATAPSPQRTSITASPETNLATRTGITPLSRSPATTTAA